MSRFWSIGVKTKSIDLLARILRKEPFSSIIHKIEKEFHGTVNLYNYGNDFAYGEEFLTENGCQLQEEVVGIHNLDEYSLMIDITCTENNYNSLSTTLMDFSQLISLKMNISVILLRDNMTKLIARFENGIKY